MTLIFLSLAGMAAGFFGAMAVFFKMAHESDTAFWLFWILGCSAVPVTASLLGLS